MISRAHLQEIVDQARAEAPNEACGLLATRGDRVVASYPLTNVDASPVHYTVDPQEQLRALIDIDERGWELGAIFHSHTHTRAYPSATDIGLAFYPDIAYVIISLARPEPEVRAFRIRDGVVHEEPIAIVSGEPVDQETTV